MGDVYSAILTLGFGGGTALFAVLAVLSWKSRRVDASEPGALGLAAVGFLWNAGQLLLHIAMHTGVNRSSTSFRLFDAVAYASTALLPAVVLAGLEPVAWGGRWQARGARLLLVISWTMAGVVIAILLATAARWTGLTVDTAKSLSAYNLLFHLAAAGVIYRGSRLRSAVVRDYARILVVLGIFLALCLILVLKPMLSDPLEDVLNIASQLVSIPMGIASLTLVARFRFADVFIRRSASLLAALAIATAFTLLMVPLVSAVQTASIYPRTAGWIVTAAVLCALLLVFPRLERALGRGADRLLLRRPDYRALAREFVDEIDALGSESDVFDAATRLVRTALRAEDVRVVAGDEVPGLGDGAHLGGAFMLSTAHPARGAHPGAHFDALAPIWSGGGVSHALAVTLGEQGRALLTDELAFLSIVGERTGREVEALRAGREQRERQLREAGLQRLVTEAQLKALRAQLNPHFLFNTLNTILDMIVSDPAKAEAVTERLADVLRYVLARTDRDVIPVDEEVDFLRAYIEIERARFGDRLRSEMTVDRDVAAEPVPPLILQPLVENAIRHGLAPKHESGTVRVLARGHGPFLLLVVEDDGVGWPAAGASRRSSRLRPDGTGGVGVRNVEERLRTMYGDEASMTVSGGPGRGTRVEILIPRCKREDPDSQRRSAGAVEVAPVAERLP